MELNKLMRARGFAERLFAGDTGFSDEEMIAFFNSFRGVIDKLRFYTSSNLQLQNLPSVDPPRRRLLFRNSIGVFSYEIQIDILRGLCRYDGPLQHGQPSQKDLQGLANLVEEIDLEALIKLEQTKHTLITEGVEANMQQKTENAPDPRNVFIVHGRNLEAYNELASFLSALDLHPIDWSEAVSFTREGSPYIGTVLDTAFSNAQAVVVLFTPDDEARLRKLYRKTDETREASLIPQPRPNVIFEAGMAFGRYPERTILVELGELRGFSDTEGRHAIRLNDSAPTRNDLAQRLESAGCRVNTKGDRWLKAGNFSDSIVNISYTEEPSLESDWSKSYHTLWLILDLSFAETMIMNHEALDSVEVTQDKLRRAYEHASQVGLIETEPGRQLAKLVEQANSTFATEWTPQKRDYFHRQIDICRNASLKLIETYHESAV